MIRQLSAHTKDIQMSGPRFTEAYVRSMVPMLEKRRGTEEILYLFSNPEFVTSIEPLAAQSLIQKISANVESVEARKLLSNLNLLEKLTPSEVSPLVLTIIKNEDPHISYDILIDPKLGNLMTPDTFNRLVSNVEKGNVIQQIYGLLNHDVIRAKLPAEKISILLNRIKGEADSETTFEVVSTLLKDPNVVLSFDQLRPFLMHFFKKIIASDEISLIENFAIQIAKIISEQGSTEQKRGAHAAFYSAYNKTDSYSLRAILLDALKIVQEPSN